MLSVLLCHRKWVLKFILVNLNLTKHICINTYLITALSSIYLFVYQYERIVDHSSSGIVVRNIGDNHEMMLNAKAKITFRINGTTDEEILNSPCTNF